MGKLNAAKMANFMEIDCVSCPANSLLDSKEFYRPIVTPFELEIALNPYDEPHFSLVTGKFKQNRRYAFKDSSQGNL
ncbi:hypothetical protein C2G38_2086957 [Gigaspora rosea]|uniref:Uncharacterized protein n=1 Tax=Gigaspora rosea TaxID=44941 RepID=A0A397V6A8_9GLOM|nr:hypothetical protein C2G38_2086957 [Gigaspora rosea]